MVVPNLHLSSLTSENRHIQQLGQFFCEGPSVGWDLLGAYLETLIIFSLRAASTTCFPWKNDLQRRRSRKYFSLFLCITLCQHQIPQFNNAHVKQG